MADYFSFSDFERSTTKNSGDRVFSDRYVYVYDGASKSLQIVKNSMNIEKSDDLEIKVINDKDLSLNARDINIETNRNFNINNTAGQTNINIGKKELNVNGTNGSLLRVTNESLTSMVPFITKGGASTEINGESIFLGTEISTNNGSKNGIKNSIIRPIKNSLIKAQLQGTSTSGLIHAFAISNVQNTTVVGETFTINGNPITVGSGTISAAQSNINADPDFPSDLYCDVISNGANSYLYIISKTNSITSFTIAGSSIFQNRTYSNEANSISYSKQAIQVVSDINTLEVGEYFVIDYPLYSANDKYFKLKHKIANGATPTKWIYVVDPTTKIEFSENGLQNSPRTYLVDASISGNFEFSLTFTGIIDDITATISENIINYLDVGDYFQISNSEFNNGIFKLENYTSPAIKVSEGTFDQSETGFPKTLNIKRIKFYDFVYDYNNNNFSTDKKMKIPVLETGNLEVTQYVSLNDNINIIDNKKILIGTDNDLEIYHNETNSVISNNTGSLNISGTTINITGNVSIVGNTQVSNDAYIGSAGNAQILRLKANDIEYKKSGGLAKSLFDGLVPVGAIIAIHPGAIISSAINSSNWILCSNVSGTATTTLTYDDNTTTSVIIPKLEDDRFIMGSSTFVSPYIGGNNSPSHRHNYIFPTHSHKILDTIPGDNLLGNTSYNSNTFATNVVVDTYLVSGTGVGAGVVNTGPLYSGTYFWINGTSYTSDQTRLSEETTIDNRPKYFSSKYYMRIK